MELPDTLQKLYRHWPKHAVPIAPGDLSEVIIDPELRHDIEDFIAERVAIWAKKQRGETAPYTHDSILRTFRFCNILRELDRQTIEYHELLNPLRNDFPLWLLNMFYARMVARPETSRAVGLLSYEAVENEQLLERLLALPRPRYGTPYVFPVSTILRSTTPTRELFIARYLPTVIPRIADEIETWNGQSVEHGVKKILPLFGYGLSFLWTEVLIDAAYQFPDRIDLFGPFTVGPGAAPTFARISSHSPADVAQKLGSLRIQSGITYQNTPIVLSSENWEGIGCEFRKYTNLSSGKGRRRYYKSL